MRFSHRDKTTIVGDGVEQLVHKPVDAIVWTGRNADEVTRWAQDMIVSFPHERLSYGDLVKVIDKDTDHAVMAIKNSVFPRQTANHGDWIVFNEHGEFSPMEPEYFDKLYEPNEI